MKVQSIIQARRSTTVAIVLLFAISLMACSSGSVFDRTGGSSSGSKRYVTSARQLQDYDVQLLDSSWTKLSQLVGKNKVIVLDFWATWCGPCIKGIPHLVALQNEYKEQGVEVIGLSIEDPRTEVGKVKASAQALAINYQLGFSSEEMFMAFTGNDGAIPQTFIFGRDGNLIYRMRGTYPNPHTMRAILKENIEKALKTS